MLSLSEQGQFITDVINWPCIYLPICAILEWQQFEYGA